MKKNRRAVSGGIAALCSIVLVAGAVTLESSPASAKGSINWQHVWKTEIKPRADKRYYTKTKANGLFATRSALAGYTPLGTSYSKAESDGKYAAPGSSYTKAESDAKYAPFPSVIRGTFDVSGAATGGGQYLTSSISFGVTLSAAPTIKYIQSGAPVPAGCSGTPQAPNASPGFLCVFEETAINATSRGTYDPTTPSALFASSNPLGITVFATSTAAGQVFSFGTWAVRPLAVSSSKVPASKSDGLSGHAVR